MTEDKKRPPEHLRTFLILWALVSGIFIFDSVYRWGTRPSFLFSSLLSEIIAAILLGCFLAPFLLLPVAYIHHLIQHFRKNGLRFSLGFLMAWIVTLGLFTTLSFTHGQVEREQETPKGKELFYERYGWPLVSIQTRKRWEAGYYTHRPEIQPGGVTGNILIHALTALIVVQIGRRVTRKRNA